MVTEKLLLAETIQQGDLLCILGRYPGDHQSREGPPEGQRNFAPGDAPQGEHHTGTLFLELQARLAFGGLGDLEPRASE